MIEPRVEELFQLVANEIKRSGFQSFLRSGIVLTGGAAKMPGMTELAEELFHLPVRVGVPKYFGGLSEVVKDPRFSTAIGLMLIGRDHLQKTSTPKLESTSALHVFSRMKAWFAGNF